MIIVEVGIKERKDDFDAIEPLYVSSFKSIYAVIYPPIETIVDKNKNKIINKISHKTAYLIIADNEATIAKNLKLKVLNSVDNFPTEYLKNEYIRLNPQDKINIHGVSNG